MTIDIMEWEFVTGIPHWLSVEGRCFFKVEEIRERRRAEWLNHLKLPYLRGGMHVVKGAEFSDDLKLFIKTGQANARKALAQDWEMKRAA